MAPTSLAMLGLGIAGWWKIGPLTSGGVQPVVLLVFGAIGRCICTDASRYCLVPELQTNEDEWMRDGHSSMGKSADELRGSTRRQRVVSWCRQKSVVLFSAAMVISVGVLLAQPPSVPDLSEENRAMVPTLLSEWQEGDVIVLLRHLERGDRADSPCLHGRKKGITVRAVDQGYELGKGFSRFGLASTDISNSPLARTAQTSKIVFGRVEDDQGWLYRCKEEMLENVLQRKKQGRNLILVTHSGCMQAFQSEMGFDDDTPDYGTALFVSKDHATKELQILGFLDIEDWGTILDF